MNVTCTNQRMFHKYTNNIIIFKDKKKLFLVKYIK